LLGRLPISPTLNFKVGYLWIGNFKPNFLASASVKLLSLMLHSVNYHGSNLLVYMFVKLSQSINQTIKKSINQSTNESIMSRSKY
jgi:hypothetical protein